jgi:hypothetical protein
MNGSGHVAWNICSMQKMVPLSLSRDDTLEGQMVLQSVMLIIHPNLNKEMIKESYN